MTGALAAVIPLMPGRQPTPHSEEGLDWVQVGTICYGCHGIDGAHGTTLVGRPCPFAHDGPMPGRGQQPRYGWARPAGGQQLALRLEAR